MELSLTSYKEMHQMVVVKLSRGRFKHQKRHPPWYYKRKAVRIESQRRVRHLLILRRRKW